MARVIDRTQDSDAFSDIKEFAGISDSNGDIDSSPLLRVAETWVITEVPDAELPDGRTHAKREDIVNATVFFAVSNYLRASDYADTGGTSVKSETIGAARREYATESVSISKEDRALWFETEARRLLNSIGTTSTDTTAIATVKFKGGF